MYSIINSLIIVGVVTRVVRGQGGDIHNIIQSSVTSVINAAEQLSNEDTDTDAPPEEPPVDKNDAFLTAPEIIIKNGFPLEIHHVHTADGYILTNHRIPRPGSFPIFLSHGILCSSRDWLMQRGHNALAYRLYNEGYDVWLGNTRGNIYSPGHVNLTQDKYQYWDFTVDQVALYDVPANIDYVLRVTNSEQLGWIGYSLGTSILLIGLTEKPEYQDKIKLFVGVAPVSETTHCHSDLSRILAGLTLPEEPLKSTLTLAGHGKFMPSMIAGLTSRFLPGLCAPGIDIPDFCGSGLALVGGFNVKEIDNDMQSVIYGGFPSSVSVRMLVQQLQGVISGAGTWRRYNYQDSCKNWKMYGRRYPPEIDVGKFKVPSLLFAGKNDYLAGIEDVVKLAGQLPNLKFFYNVTDPSWSHLDFVFAKKAKKLVYDPLVEQLKTYIPPHL